MNLSRRVDKLEAASGGGGPCSMCERRAERVEQSPVMQFGFTESPDSSFSLTCPGCGSPFTVDVIIYSREGEA